MVCKGERSRYMELGGELGGGAAGGLMSVGATVAQ